MRGDFEPFSWLATSMALLGRFFWWKADDTIYEWTTHFHPTFIGRLILALGYLFHVWYWMDWRLWLGQLDPRTYIIFVALRGPFLVFSWEGYACTYLWELVLLGLDILVMAFGGF